MEIGVYRHQWSVTTRLIFWVRVTHKMQQNRVQECYGGRAMSCPWHGAVEALGPPFGRHAALRLFHLCFKLHKLQLRMSTGDLVMVGPAVAHWTPWCKLLPIFHPLYYFFVSKLCMANNYQKEPAKIFVEFVLINRACKLKGQFNIDGLWHVYRTMVQMSEGQVD